MIFSLVFVINNDFLICENFVLPNITISSKIRNIKKGRVGGKKNERCRISCFNGLFKDR